MKSKISGLVLALTLGVASVSMAQQPTQTPPERGQRADRAERADRAGRADRQGGGFASLLSGIDLTAAQKDQLKAIREKNEDKSDKKTDGERRKQLKAARENDDTTTLRRLRTEMQGEMKQRREAMITDIRGVLTPSQLETFDRNVAEARQRMENGRERGKHRPGGEARDS